MPFLLRVELPDVPGSLGRVASAIGEAGGDIEAIEIVEKRHDANTAVTRAQDHLRVVGTEAAVRAAVAARAQRATGLRQRLR